MGVNGIWYGTYPLVSNPLVSLVVGKEMNSTFPSALVKFTKRASKELWNIMEHPTILISDPGAAKGQRPQWGTNFFSADCGMVTVNWPPVSSPQRVGNKPTWWSKAAWSRPLKSGNQDWVWNGGKNDQPVEEWGTLRHTKWWTTGTTCTFGDIWKCGAWLAQVFCVSCV